MSGATSIPPVAVGVRELKNKLSGYLDRVQAGEQITVTAHGRPIARLTPIAPEEDRMAALIDAGVIVPARDARRRLPAKRVTLIGEGTISDLVAQQRR